MVQATDQDASGVPRFRVIGSCPTGQKPHGRPGLPGGITCPSWPGSTFGSPQEELESIANRKKVWTNLLSPLPLEPDFGLVEGKRVDGNPWS